MSNAFAEMSEVEKVGRRVIGCGIEVHRQLGPGYKEPIYVEALCLEMDSPDLQFEGEKAITVTFKTHDTTSYSKTTGLRLGFIVNFNLNVLMPDGFERIVLCSGWSL